MAEMNQRIRTLVVPLDWGLGHASRCVPLIHQLIADDHELILAASGDAKAFLKSQFPTSEILDKPGYNIRYYRSLPASWSVLFQVPKIIFSIWKEHQWLKKIIREKQPDEVISDNCYGLWNKKIHSVFMTHQLMVKCPPPFKFLEGFFHRIILWFTQQFDECWIPDIEGPDNLSEDLSHRYPLPANTTFIGWLSRFRTEENKNDLIPEYDICILLSGPEPFRSMLEEDCIAQLKEMTCSGIIIRGKPGEGMDNELRRGLRIVSHLEDHSLAGILRKSKMLVCRSGYSTIMDLKSLGKKAILVPTPGQTEQEYLAKHLAANHDFRMIEQDKLKLEEEWSKLNSRATTAEEKRSVRF